MEVQHRSKKSTVSVIASMNHYYHQKQWELLEEVVVLPLEIKNKIIQMCTNDTLPKIEGCVENIVPRYNTTAFKSHFRILPETFETLLVFLGPHWEASFMRAENTGGKRQITLEKSVLIVLWTLATPDSYRSIAERFGVTKGTVYWCLQKIVYLLLHHVCHKIIKLPQENEKRQISEAFLNKTGFPQVVGVIDGCHIAIRRPKDDGDAYFNRKKFYSVVLQAVCREDKSFIDVDCRWPGSVHDARVLRTSPLYQVGSELCQPAYFILGDCAYPCTSWLLPPYKKNRFLNPQQIHYNEHLSKTRVVIEQAFALLKGRFRRLKYLEMHDLQDSVNMIICSCVLHNVCLQASDDVEEFLKEGMPHVHLLHENIDMHNNQQEVNEEYRNVIVDYLWNNRRPRNI